MPDMSCNRAIPEGKCQQKGFTSTMKTTESLVKYAGHVMQQCQSRGCQQKGFTGTTKITESLVKYAGHVMQPCEENATIQRIECSLKIK